MDNVVRLEYAYGVCPKCNRGDYLRYLIRNDGLIHKPYEIACINCNSYFTKEDIWGRGEETAPKPITNADRIWAMKDDMQLAIFFASVSGCPYDREIALDKCESWSNACVSCWQDWLKQGVEDAT